MAGGPLDIRSALYQECFSQALSYDAYVQTGTEAQQARWNAYRDQVQLSTAQEKILSSFKRRIHILVVSGVWCGDCMRQCPILAAFAESNSCIDLKFIDNQQHPVLRDEVRVNGGTRVPVALFLSEDFFEVSRFGDRTLGRYRQKAAQELGDACDAGIALKDETFELEISEWLMELERVHYVLRLSPMLRERYND